MASWVVYELVDPLGDRVVHRDYDTVEYLEMIRAYPIIDEGCAGYQAVDRVYRAGRVPYLRELTSGISEARARALVRGMELGPMVISHELVAVG